MQPENQQPQVPQDPSQPQPQLQQPYAPVAAQPVNPSTPNYEAPAPAQPPAPSQQIPPQIVIPGGVPSVTLPSPDTFFAPHPSTRPGVAPVQPQNPGQQPIAQAQQFFQSGAPQASGFVPQTQFESTTPPKNKMMRIVLIVIAFLVIGGGAYFVSTLGKKTDGSNSNTTNNAAKKSVSKVSTTGNLASLQNFTFSQPDAAQLGGMALDTGTAASSYTILMSADQECTIGFGIIPQSELPGTDIGSIFAARTAQVKAIDSNIQVVGPNDMAAIVLAGSDGKTYAIPTVNYSYTDPTTDGGSLVETFSAVQLADSTHAVVYSACNDDTPSDQAALTARLTALRPVVNAIKINIK